MVSLFRALVVLPLAIGAAAAAAAPPIVTDAWIRATPPGAVTAAAYLTIASAGAADRLVGATTPAADTVEIHTTASAVGSQRMMRVAELALPAGGRVRLEPGGQHLMLIDLKAPMVPGTKVALSLRFAEAGTVEVDVPVVDARAQPAAPH
ncbi:MAG TPA: copper chaperone PCu(A)C [Gammaproteobacteria bacterium]|nr:copper chaperone PCu(A)C [Gammaproteobacteria bacterium]